MYACVIVGAGSGTRANLGYNKLRYLINQKPLLLFAIEPFIKRDYEIVLVVNKEDETFFKAYLPAHIKITTGGSNRSESVKNGLLLVESKYVLIHDAARVRITEDMIRQVEQGLALYKACFLAKRVTDTLYQIDQDMKLLDRNKCFQAETPQAFLTKEILEAYEKTEASYSDDVSLYRKYYGTEVGAIVHEDNNQKMTYQSDIRTFEKEIGETMYKIGTSYDIHQLSTGRKLILGGIEIPHDKGLLGHSDADCLLHAVAESILGALGLGDLGTLFPDTDMKNKDMDSKLIVNKAVELMKEQGFKVANIDTMIFAEKPKLATYMPQIKESIAALLQTHISNVNVKAGTNEKMDAIGAEKAIAAQATVLLIKE